MSDRGTGPTIGIARKGNAEHLHFEACDWIGSIGQRFDLDAISICLAQGKREAAHPDFNRIPPEGRYA